MTDQKIIEYIKQNKKQGFSDDQIKKALLGAGWKNEDIDQGFKSISEPSISRPKPKWLIPVIVVVGVVVLGLVVWGGYSLLSFPKIPAGGPFNEWRVCNNNSDCVETRIDCCGCDSGGTQTAINKQYLDKWENLLKKGCREIEVCLMEFNCKEGNPVCENNKCEFKISATEGWKTYRNEEYGWEIQYPEDWNRIIVSDNWVAFDRPDKTYPGPDTPTYDFNIKVDKVTVSDLDQWAIQEAGGQEVITESKDVTIDGISAKRIEYFGFHPWYLAVAAIGDGDLYKFSTVNKEIILTFNQILSTFKFLE